MPIIDIEINCVMCSECGTNLTFDNNRYGALLIIPCPTCLEAARDEGRQEKE